jgi:hypothetical protein
LGILLKPSLAAAGANNQGGFFMAARIPDSTHQDSAGFRKVLDAFLARPGLPFAEILSAERIQGVFEKHGGLFGRHGVYTTAIMV